MKKVTDPIKIGGIKLKSRLILAPMAGVTDAAFRKLASDHKAALTFSEMISDHAFHYESEKTMKMLETHDKTPYGVQIFGSSLQYIIDLVRFLDKNPKVDIIDFNMGCPMPKIAIKSRAGAFYLRDLNLIYKTVKLICDNTKKPVFVKIRSGWDENTINAPKVAQVLEKAGVAAITIHPRTKAQLYSGKADWSIIKKVKASVKIPVIGNGDVLSYNDAQRMLNETNCDAVMIGRAALGNPMIFEQILLASKNKKKVVTSNDLISLIKKHYLMLFKIYGRKVADLKIKAHILWYLKDKKYNDIKRVFMNNQNFVVLLNSLKNFDR